jgi:hypothetical protein
MTRTRRSALGSGREGADADVQDGLPAVCRPTTQVLDLIMSHARQVNSRRPSAPTAKMPRVFVAIDNSSSEDGQIGCRGLSGPVSARQGRVLDRRVPDAADRGVASRGFGVISSPARSVEGLEPVPGVADPTGAAGAPRSFSRPAARRSQPAARGGHDSADTPKYRPCKHA